MQLENNLKLSEERKGPCCKCLNTHSTMNIYMYTLGKLAIKYSSYIQPNIFPMLHFHTEQPWTPFQKKIGQDCFIFMI